MCCELDGERGVGTERHSGGGCSYPGRDDGARKRNPNNQPCTKNFQLSTRRATPPYTIYHGGHSIYHDACYIVELDSLLALEMGTCPKPGQPG